MSVIPVVGKPIGEAKYIIEFPDTLKKLQFVNAYESPKDLYLALKAFPYLHTECWPVPASSSAAISPTGSTSSQQTPAQFALTSSSPTSGPASGGTLIVIRGSGLSSVNKVVMNPVRPDGVNPTLHSNFSVVSDGEIDVTSPAGVAGLTYEIDFFTPCCEYFTTNFSGIPLFTFE